MFVTNAVQALALGIQTSIASTKPASLYVGVSSLPSGIVADVTRLSASYSNAFVKASVSTSDAAWLSAWAGVVAVATSNQFGSSVCVVASFRLVDKALPLKSYSAASSSPAPSNVKHARPRRLLVSGVG